MQVPQPETARVFSFSTTTSHTDTHTLRVDVENFYGLYRHLKKCTKLISLTRAEYDELPESEQKRLKNAPCIILATFKHPNTRTDEDVEHCTALGLDVDEAHIELADLKVLLSGYRAIVYESVRSTPAFRRWRVIIHYESPLPVEKHAMAFAYWRARIPGVAASVCNPARVWYVPTRLKGDEGRIIEYLEGQSFAGSVIVPLARSPQQILLERIPSDPSAPAKAGERNNRLAAYAASIVRDAATLDMLAGALTAKNAEYAPPLPAKEVQTIARTTWKKRAKFGWHEPQQEVTGEEISLDMADLLASDPGIVPWLVSDLMTTGAHLLVGRPKGGKSWVTLDLAYACGKGGSFVGRQTRRTGVLWIAGEDTNDSLARRLQVRGEPIPKGMVSIYTGQGLKQERALWEACSFDQWLREYLVAHPAIGLVIIDTHKTCEAIWESEQIDKRRSASAVDIAYQSVRLYEDIGQQTQTCILLVHHMGKMKHNKGTDYHERINLPATVVAGVSGSLVLADHPERELHDEEDHRRVLAVRGRHMAQGDEALMVEMKGGRVSLLGKYVEVQQTQAQQRIFEMIESILNEKDSTTIAEVAAEMGLNKNATQVTLSRAAKKPNGLMWKGKKLVIQQKRGLFWAK